MANKNKWSTIISLAIKEIQKKTILPFHLILDKTAMP